MFKIVNLSPEIEEKRLNALYSYDILGEGLADELDNLVKLAAQIAAVPMAYISFADRDEIILKSSFGLDTSYKKIPRNLTICEHTMHLDHIFVIPDILIDPKIAANPMFNIGNGIRFYASAPLIDKEGFALGCLSLLDEKPNDLEVNQIEALETLAIQIITHLSLKRKNSQLEIQTKKYQEFKEIFTISPEIHCILDRKGSVLFINDAVTNILHYEAAEVFGKNIWNAVHREDLKRVIGEIEQGLSAKNKQFALDFRLISKTNQFKWVSWNMIAKEDKWYCYGRDITETKRVEAELTKLSFVASKINNGVVINDSNNNVSWINHAFEKITGFNLADLQGKQLGEFLIGPLTDISVIDKARKFTEKKQSFTVDLLAYRKDKKPIWLTIYHTVVLDEEGKVETDVEIIIDITDKKKAEEELQILSLVANNTNTGVAIANEVGKITWVNKALEDLIGYTFVELKDKMLGDVLSTAETNNSLILEARTKAVNKEASTIEVLAENKKGEQIWLSVANTPVINANGKLERQVELINDITQRKQTEREMIESREQAIQLSEAKEMFLSIMSHEIRTPLNAVIGMTHLLLENNPMPSQIDDLNILKFSGENLLNIINDILDYTKIETGNLQLESIPFDLHTLCVDSINSLQINANKRGNFLSLNYDGHIPIQILGDRTRLYQILINLLSNAIKFTENGKVELHVKLLENVTNDVSVYFEIIDNGIGIPNDKLNYIFETFTQARADISRNYGGTGLGLPITKKLLKLYKSEINVQSTMGVGTTFNFTINFNETLNTQKLQEPATLPNLFTGKEILVVDDNEVNILIAKRILTNWGFKIDFAINGEEAIHKIIANKYDFVFMDIRMPGIDGFDATKIIRDMEGDYFKQLPIFALTASTLQNEKLKFKEAGMDGHILKPFNPKEIKALLATYFNK